MLQKLANVTMLSCTGGRTRLLSASRRLLQHTVRDSPSQPGQVRQELAHLITYLNPACILGLSVSFEPCAVQEQEYSSQMVPVGGLVYYISPPTSLTEVSLKTH